MNKYLKWTTIIFAILAILLTAGCAKSVLEGAEQPYRNSFTSGSSGVVQSRPVETAVQMEIAHDSKMIEPMPPGYYPHPEDHYGSGEDIEAELKIIRTANMQLEVEDHLIASQKAEAFAKKYNGYISNSNTRADQNNKHSGTVTIRIPDMHFDAAIAELTLLGEVKSKNVNGQDVTEEYIDLESRIKNAEKHEERLVQMFRNATDVDEMMQIERELNRVREQIERNEGKLRYLENKVSLSTVTVHMYEPQPAVKEWGVWKSVKRSLNHSLATLRWMIELIGWLLPLIVTGLLIGLITRWRVKRKKRRTKRN